MLTNTLYIAFTTHLTNFFFSIPAVIIKKFSYLKIDQFITGKHKDWLVALIIFAIGIVSVLNIWGLLLKVEAEDR